jgi:hypothetical protein
MKSRSEIGGYLNDLGLLGVGVEVGVFEGAFSETILDTWKGTKLYLVDPWAVLPGYGPGLGLVDGKDFNASKASQADWDKVFEDCKRRLERFGERAEMLRLSSFRAAAQFANESLDFIYIDGDHSFEAVSIDLAIWYPKLKHGGFFSGHDYLLGTKGRSAAKRIRHGNKWVGSKRYQVKEAVDAFAFANGIWKVELTSETGTNISWHWVKK